MAQMTQDLARSSLDKWCKHEFMPPLTVGEVQQLIHCWLESQALRQDAERYRWLRDRKEMDWSICNWCEDDREWMPEVRSPEVVDRAIDAAMKT